MNDSKITKKAHSSGSLPQRIVWISLLLIGVPLFLQTLFLYREEYKQKLEDTKGDLALLAQERAFLIEEMIQADWNFLEEIGGAFQGKAPPSVKPVYIQKIPLPPNVPKRFVSKGEEGKFLWVGAAVSEGGALAVPLFFDSIGKELPGKYPIWISLSDAKGNSVWENEKGGGEPPFLSGAAWIPSAQLKIELAVETRDLQGLHLRDYYFRFASLLFFVGILGGGVLYAFSKRIGKPLFDLCHTMERVSEGASHARYTPDWMGFEINQLGLRFNQTLDALLEMTQRAETEKGIRQRLASELRIGHEIQASLFPPPGTQLNRFDWAGRYFPAREVNGDFYDLFELENGNILIAICDTAGKGISACLFSLGLRSLLRSFATVASDLKELIRRVNDLYWIDSHSSSMFSTAWIGIYNPRLRTLLYSNQGHPPALFVRGSEVAELSTPGIALGAQKFDSVQINEIVLQKGDLLILYTDGILEAHNGMNERFGKKRIWELIVKEKRGTAAQIGDALIENVRLFAEGSPQHDDIALVVLRLFD